MAIGETTTRGANHQESSGEVDFTALEERLQLPAPLRPYQWRGVAHLSDSSAALLADEMGLGKTVQVAVAIRLLVSVNPASRVLIVCPSSLRLNWQRELQKWAPELVVRPVDGTPKERTVLYKLPVHVLIASYEQIRTDALQMNPANRFDLVVLDEAQRIKNASAATAHACRLIPRHRSWLLSGTPVENRPDDLVSLFAFLKPGLIQRGSSRSHIHDRIQPHFLRRTKADVLPDLPPIIEQEVMLDLAGAQKIAYEEVWFSRHAIAASQGGEAGGSLLALITQLKQLCNVEPLSGESVKLNALRVIIENLSGSEAKLILFSQYVETLKWLEHEIEEIPTQLFHGGLSPDERDLIVQRFQETPGPQILLMSIRAGGVGLNLQAATAVVLFDRWWNPAVEDQAVQRAHRFGRQMPLHVFKFLVRGTIEERIDELLKEKSDLFTEYVEEAENATPVVSGGQLWRLLDITPGAVTEEIRQHQAIEDAREREGE